MFYSVQILKPKGPLGIIWIAATLDKRLKRAQVFEANLEENVGAHHNALPARASSTACGRWTDAEKKGLAVVAQRKRTSGHARCAQIPSSTPRRRSRCGCQGSCCWAW